MRVAEVESDLQTAVSDESDDESCRRSKRKRKETAFSDDESEDSDNTCRSNRIRPNLPKPPPVVSLVRGKQQEKRPSSTIHLLNQTAQRSPAPSAVASSSKQQEHRTAPTPIISTVASGSQVIDSVQSLRSENFFRSRDLRLLKGIETILEELSQQRGMLQSLMNMTQNTTQNETVSLPPEVSFPIGTIEEMNLAEVEFEDKTVCNSTVNYLSVLGGKNTSETVKRILRHTLQSRLAEKYNWYGKKGKLPFGQLKLATIIQKSVRKTIKTATEAEVEGITRDWLRTACDRDGGRKRREKNRQAPIETAGNESN